MKSAIAQPLKPATDIGEDTPIALIKLTKKGFEVDEEALRFIRSIEQNISVITVCGKYRTGKSYLLNKVILNREGFTVGPSIHPCTKGIWMWKRPMQYKVEDENVYVLVMDTEGLAAFDEEENHDTKIMILSLLISSQLIYNTMGPIDETALQSLSLVIDIANKIIQENNDDNSEECISKNFPSFLWILRDFTLRLEDSQKNPITSKQYLENSLALQKGLSDQVESKNRIRKLFKTFFPDRDCCTVVRPTENEKELQSLITLPEHKLRKEFLVQIDQLKAKIFKKIRPKVLNQKKLNGNMLANLIVSYTNSINQGKVPCIENAWTYICKDEQAKLFNYVEKQYESQLKTKIIDKLPMPSSEYRTLKNAIKAQCLSDVQNKMIGDNTIDKAQLTIIFQKANEKFKRDYMDKAREVCKECLGQIITTMQEKSKSGEYQSFLSLKEDLFTMLEKVPQNVKECKGYKECETEMIASDIFTLACNAWEYMQNKQALNVNLLQEKADNAEKALIGLKTNQEKEIDEISQIAKSCEEEKNRLTMQNKYMEEKIKTMQNEYEKMEDKWMQKLNEVKRVNDESSQALIVKEREREHSNRETTEQFMAYKLESEKQMSLMKQKIEFIEKASAEKESALGEREAELRTLRSKMEQKEKRVIELEDEVRHKKEKAESTEKKELEQTMWKKQIDFFTNISDENKKFQDTVLNAISQGFNSNKHKESELDATNKGLLSTIYKLEKRCVQLELKAESLLKYQQMFLNTASIECKGCSNKYPKSVFQQHTKLCKSLEKPAFSGQINN